MLKPDIIAKLAGKVSLKAIGGFMLTVVPAAIEALDQKKQKETVAELVKKVAELEQKVNK